MTTMFFHFLYPTGPGCHRDAVPTVVAIEGRDANCAVVGVAMVAVDAAVDGAVDGAELSALIGVTGVAGVEGEGGRMWSTVSVVRREASRGRGSVLNWADCCASLASR